MPRGPLRLLIILFGSLSLFTPSAFAAGNPGSISFSGSQYVTSTLSSTPGTGNFTFEFWFYLQDASTPNQGLMNTRSGNTRDGLDAIVNANSGTAGILGVSYKGRWLFESASGAIASKTWYHLALVRTDYSTLKIYLNGNLQSSLTLDSDGKNFSSSHLIIGAIGGFSFPVSGKMTGNISNFRYSKSIVYTSSFTPVKETLDLTADTKVLLKTLNDSTFLDDSAIGSNIFTNDGGAVASELSPFVETISKEERSARDAAAARAEYEKRQREAESRLLTALYNKERITLELLSAANIYGANPENINAVNYEIYSVYDKSKQDISLVSKVVQKYYMLDKVQAGQKYYYGELVNSEILTEETSIHRSVIMRFLATLDPKSLSSVEAIKSAAGQALINYEARRNRIVKTKSR